MNIDPEKGEITSDTENEMYYYKTVLIKEFDAAIKIRIRKSDNVYQCCINSLLEVITRGQKQIKIKDFLQHPIVEPFSPNIQEDNGDYYTYNNSFNEIFTRFVNAKGSGMDYNVTRPQTLTVSGAIHADSAILGGFRIDNEKFSSLAETKGNTNITLNGHDGSGHLAGGNIAWDAIGNLLIRGWFESNNSGNRILIDPADGSLRMIAVNGDEVIKLVFQDNWGMINIETKQHRTQIYPHGVVVGKTEDGGKTIHIQNNSIAITDYSKLELETYANVIYEQKKRIHLL